RGQRVSGRLMLQVAMGNPAQLVIDGQKEAVYTRVERRSSCARIGLLVHRNSSCGNGSELGAGSDEPQHAVAGNGDINGRFPLLYGRRQRSRYCTSSSPIRIAYAIEFPN